MYCDIFVCYVSMFHKLLYYFKRNQFVFSPELIFFFVSIKVLPRFINHLHVKGFSSNLSSRTWVRDKYIFSQLSQGKSYGFEVWSQGKSYRNLQKVRESFLKKDFPTLEDFFGLKLSSEKIFLIQAKEGGFFVLLCYWISLFFLELWAIFKII